MLRKWLTAKFCTKVNIKLYDIFTLLSETPNLLLPLISLPGYERLGEALDAPYSFTRLNIRGCIQKFPDSVDNEIYACLWYYSLRSNTKGYGGKIH
jgi:hypothetical protein